DYQSLVGDGCDIQVVRQDAIAVVYGPTFGQLPLRAFLDSPVETGQFGGHPNGIPGVEGSPVRREKENRFGIALRDDPCQPIDAGHFPPHGFGAHRATLRKWVDRSERFGRPGAESLEDQGAECLWARLREETPW